MNFKTNFILAIAVCLFSVNFVNAQTIKDFDLKKNTQPIVNSLELLSQLEPVSFEYNPALNKLQLPSGIQYGFLNADTLFPALITSKNKMIPAGKNAYKSASIQQLDMESLIPFLVSSLKEQQAEINKLKEEIRSLKNSAQLE